MFETYPSPFSAIFFLPSPLSFSSPPFWWGVASAARYGVVPKVAYPESQSSGASLHANRILTQKLREAACRLRQQSEAGATAEALKAIKDKYVNRPLAGYGWSSTAA